MTLITPFERAWHHRELIRAVVRREFASRFRDSFLGWIWAIFAPLAMLAAHTTIFSIAAPAVAQGVSILDYAAASFCGLILYNVRGAPGARADADARARAFHQEVDLPAETVAWTSVIRALIYGAISFGTLIVFRLVTVHYVPWTAFAVSDRRDPVHPC